MGNFIEDIIENDLNSGRVKSIVTRFPPEPNGYLHIGHAKSICLNYYGTAVKYNGKFFLRFDDTNPAKEEDEYVKSIIEDVKFLGAQPIEIRFASDYFEFMFECAVKLINKGLAYVDDTPAEEIKKMRGDFNTSGINSKNRDKSIKENLMLFSDMREGKYKDGQMVLRAKIDMSSPNINFRDPVLYRIMHISHHRQKDKWCIYPMYDFAHTIEDFLEGITHSICTLEFENHRPLYDWVAINCELTPAPNQYEFARLNLTRTVMSKRHLKNLVDNKVVDGWDDPRMPTIQGLKRRGYTASSIKTFCEKIGVSKANSTVDIALLESCIRQELNDEADRAMAVLEPLRVEIVNRDKDFNEQLDFEYNPKLEGKIRKISFSNEIYIEKDDFCIDPPTGYKRLTVDGAVRLKGAYIIKYVSHEVDKNGQVCLVRAEIVSNSKSGSDTSGVKAKGVIHFVDAKNCVDIEFRLYNYLMDESGEKLNEQSLTVAKGKGERVLECDDIKTYQFLRNGYFIKDSKSKGLVFNKVVGLKDSFNG
ncbi:MAG: glutamine--tRNA ligase/YqeY domain fusion protein [Firmicutes bacterium]|nr:glutamine--tRNA ligase/YqeY domain fusion protein [Bacillota bacterium]